MIVPGKHHPGITGRLLVDGGIAGAVIAVGFLVMGLLGPWQTRWFVLGALILGSLLGLTLWWKHH